MACHLDIVFYSPDSKRLDEWIACLGEQGLQFTPVRWRAGMAGSGGEVCGGLASAGGTL